MNYYSYKYIEVMEMINSDYVFLYQNMIHAKAKNRLDDLELLMYTKTSESNRNKIHKKLHKLATPEVEQAKRAVTADDLKGFGVSIEDLVKAKNGR